MPVATEMVRDGPIWPARPETAANRLASIPPGPELAEALAAVDRTTLDGYSLVQLLQAVSRQVSHLQAEMLAVMTAIAAADDQPFGTAESEGFVADEIRAALCWTRRAAESQLDLAFMLVERFPAVWEALWTGRIDLPRARVIVTGLDTVPEELAGWVVDRVLDWAGNRTTGEIAARIRKLLISLDPHLASVRYRKGLEWRRLLLTANSDGTANLMGLSLPADRANTAIDRLDHLARQAKTRDEERTLDQLRADLLLDLLEGNPVKGEAGRRRGVVDLRVDLTTLAGLDANPGEIPGWGPVIADVCRQIAQHGEGQWQVTVTEGGRPVWTGTTRRRPGRAQRRRIMAFTPTCVFPGCRRPTQQSDLDHNQPWHQGGETEDPNLAPLCRHDHRVKDQGGWKLHQPQPGVYVWTSPLGHTYVVIPEPP
ncbi:MAG: DUF222 domain-containing protein [Actinomycetota bacterium]